jgi:ABC-type phosphate transport system permease subunit
MIYSYRHIALGLGFFVAVFYHEYQKERKFIYLLGMILAVIVLFLLLIEIAR